MIRKIFDDKYLIIIFFNIFHKNCTYIKINVKHCLMINVYDDGMLRDNEYL